MNNDIPHPRRIVGIDGSGPSRAALRWAAARTDSGGAPLVLAHVASSESEPGAGERLLEDAAALVHAEYPGVAVEPQTLMGPVWQALSHAAGPDDIIVIGTHKTGRTHGRVTGSLSVQLAMTAPCAVAVVPDLDLRFRRGVVAGVGRPETAARVAEGAYAEAHRGNVLITLVHGGCPGRCAEALDAAEQALGSRMAPASVRRRTVASPVADALLDASLDKELLVLGPGMRAEERAPIGAVTHAVLMNAHTPVLLMGPSDPRDRRPA
jgi:nucleotide-binding universal stress UspA family protein